MERKKTAAKPGKTVAQDWLKKDKQMY